MDSINKNAYTDVRSRIRSQIYNRILKKPNPESYEMVSSISGTSKSVGGGISLPEKMKELLSLGSRLEASEPEASSKDFGDQTVKEKKNGGGSDEERNSSSLFPTTGSTGSPVRLGQSGQDGGEREAFISLSTLSRFLGVDRKKLQKAIFQYSTVYGEKLYNVESNSYRISIQTASIIALGKRMLERGDSRSYLQAFKLIKDNPGREIEKELGQIEEAIKSYTREPKGEAESKEEVPLGEEEKETLGIVGALSEALIEAISSITSRINEIENSILDFHYTFLKIKQEVESVKEELERIEKMATEYLSKGHG